METTGLRRAAAGWRALAYSLGILIFIRMSASDALAEANATSTDRLNREVAFNIPPEPLGPALLLFSQQADVQVMVAANSVDKQMTGGLKETLRANRALTALLQGTGLAYRGVGSTVQIVPAEVSGVTDQKPLRLAAASANDGGVTESSASSADSTADTDYDKEKEQKLAEVLVTGSRIPVTAKEGAQQVRVYSKQQIEQSGQTTLSDFLNTLPDVSVNVSEIYGSQTVGGGTTVQLHGLPLGTTLVLINGRRTEVSAVQANAGNNFFDLNNIPIVAIDRVEVVSEGSSAVYGSDAIAGVVNIVLREDLDGIEANAKYSWASGFPEWDGNFALGKRWNQGYVSVIGSFQTRGALSGSDRSATANEQQAAVCPLANIFSVSGANLPGTNSPYAAVNSDSTAPHFSATGGTLHQCGLLGYQSVLYATRREGMLLQGGYDVGSSASVFTELMYSHTRQDFDSGPPYLFGEPAFQQFTASASNPYNPYGQDVGVSQLLSSLPPSGQDTKTNFLRALVGARGNLLGSWHWEIAGWTASDRTDLLSLNQINTTTTQAALNSTDPASALNPFDAGPPGSPQLLQTLLSDYLVKFRGQTDSANAFLRGPIFQLPAGAVNFVIGGEYNREKEYFDNISSPYNTPGQATFKRVDNAVFGETRIPILGNRKNSRAGDVLAVTVAGRYDKFHGFGGKTTPQFGVELRPFESLLIRGTYGKAFKAPGLFEVNTPVSTLAGTVSDPKLGDQTDTANLVQGGNSHLRPETGQSRTVGLVYSSILIPDLQVSVTHWGIDESNSIQQLGPQVIVDNESLFPGNVVRAPTCVGGPPCPITQVNYTFVNFGNISIDGFDYQLNYKYRSLIGELSPSLSATQTYHYSVALTPGSPSVDATSKAQDGGNWAPRWKGTAALGWSRGSYSANIDGRYVGKYQDYDSTNEIGNFWIVDASFRWSFGNTVWNDNRWLKGTSIQLGGINIFNKLPQQSNYGGGSFGYDPAQGDLRGRFLYVQLSARL